MNGRSISAVVIAGMLVASGGMRTATPALAEGARAASEEARDYRIFSDSDRLLGASITNETGETIGKIDRLLFDRDYRVVAVVVEVGGFLGVGTKAVVVPMARFDATEDGFSIPDASLEQLSRMTPYRPTEAGSVLSKIEVPLSESRTRAEVDRTVSEWRQKIDRFRQSASDGTQAGIEETKERLDAAWNGVEREWANLKTATKEGWDDAQSSFDEAINELERVWQEVAG